MKRQSYLEREFSKDTLTFSITTPPPDSIEEIVAVSWNMIDQASEKYAKMLQEYDIAEIVKSFVLRYGKNKNFSVLPKPGNLDLSDNFLKFNEFYSLLEATKKKYPKHNLSKATQQEHDSIEAAAQPIVNYFLSGKHPDPSKSFNGWKASFSRAVSAKKTLVGIISIDLPMEYYTPKHQTLKYKCAGTQHYVAFAYDPRIHKLYIFDSASKNPQADHSEIVYLLKYTFSTLAKTKDSLPITEGLIFRNILQPGAGDKAEEDERSYNNQNVFCHTWSLWFSLIFICFYECDKNQICLPALNFIRSLSHRNPLINLAMIKRFAGWMTLFLQDEDEDDVITRANKKFASRAYARAKEYNDLPRLQEVLSTYALAKDPYVGLNYIYNATTKQYISIERLCMRRKLKLDIDLLDSLETIAINSYLEKSKEIRCPIGKQLNPATKRCKMTKSRV